MMTEEQKKTVESNLKLVHYIVKKYNGMSSFLEYEDLFQAGCEGLIYAAIHFDPSAGYKFSTYAFPCIEGHIQRELDGKTNLITIPYKLFQDINKWKRNKNHETLNDFINRNPEKKECIMAAYNAMLPMIYLEQPIMGEDEWNSLKDIIIDEKSDFDKWISYRMVHEMIQHFLNELSDYGFTEKQVDVLKKRYGFEGDPMTLDEIGKCYGVTRERIRQIEANSLRKICALLHNTDFGLQECIEMCRENDFSDYV